MENAAQKINFENHTPRSVEEDILPRWDLTKIYKSPEDPKLAEDLKLLRRDVKLFAKHYKGKVKDLGLKNLSTAISEYFFIQDLKYKISEYATNLYSIHLDSPEHIAFESRINSSELKNIEDKLFFFEHEVDSLPPSQQQRIKESRIVPANQKYWIRYKVDNRSSVHKEVEKYISAAPSITELSIKGWNNTTSHLKFNLNGIELTARDVQKIVREGETEEIRSAALKEYKRGLNIYAHVYENYLNQTLEAITFIKKNYGFRGHESDWNLYNEITNDEIPRRATQAINESRVEERYYRLKAKLMGKEKLNTVDVGAFLDSGQSRYIPWAECRDIIVEALTRFDPQCGKIARKAFDEGWIDAEPRRGKISGWAATVPGSLNDHPRILMQYYGTTNCVAFAAHEIGHAIQMYYTKKKQGNLLNDSTSLVSECSSTLCEELVFQEMIRRAKTPRERITIQMQKIENTMDALARSHIYEFALRAHQLYEKRGSLSVKDFDKEMLKTIVERFGNSVRDPETDAFSWMTLASLYDAPFYYGDYPMTNLIVRHIVDQYDAGKRPNFPQKIMMFMEKGGTELSPALLKRIGFNIKNPDIWKKAVAGVDTMITDLEKMVEEEKFGPSGYADS